MKTILIAIATILTATSAFAETDTFDNGSVGSPPPDWTCGITGRGTPRWTVEADISAPSRPNVLKQSSKTASGAAYPWCVKKGASLADGYVEVKFKPLEGREDQAGGLVWRWKDGNNYYIARANALENNVSLYHTTAGRRIEIRYVDAPVAVNRWHTLRIEFSGPRIKVLFDGKQYIDLTDNHISGAGSIGVWTKADSVTAFDDLAFGG
jgi:hypothetical protein